MFHVFPAVQSPFVFAWFHVLLLCSRKTAFVRSRVSCLANSSPLARHSARNPCKGEKTDSKLLIFVRYPENRARGTPRNSRTLPTYFGCVTMFSCDTDGSRHHQYAPASRSNRARQSRQTSSVIWRRVKERI